MRCDATYAEFEVLMKPAPEAITAVVLAGGRGRRFEGRDKGLVEYRQRPIVEHVIEAIENQVGAIIINANRNTDIYSRYGYPVINDVLSDYQGPLAGFAVAMEKANTSHVLTLPCDAPCVCEDYAERMAGAMDISGAALAVAHDGTRMQPVHALLPVQRLDSLRDFLRSGERKIDRWYRQHEIALVDFSDTPDTFYNINTHEELRILEELKA